MLLSLPRDVNAYAFQFCSVKDIQNLDSSFADSNDRVILKNCFERTCFISVSGSENLAWALRQNTKVIRAVLDGDKNGKHLVQYFELLDLLLKCSTSVSNLTVQGFDNLEISSSGWYPRPIFPYGTNFNKLESLELSLVPNDLIDLFLRNDLVICPVLKKIKFSMDNDHCSRKLGDLSKAWLMFPKLNSIKIVDLTKITILSLDLKAKSLFIAYLQVDNSYFVKLLEGRDGKDTFHKVYLNFAGFMLTEYVVEQLIEKCPTLRVLTLDLRGRNNKYFYIFLRKILTEIPTMSELKFVIYHTYNSHDESFDSFFGEKLPGNLRKLSLRYDPNITAEKLMNLIKLNPTIQCVSLINAGSYSHSPTMWRDQLQTFVNEFTTRKLKISIVGTADDITNYTDNNDSDNDE